jgi:hypothetical protein
MQHVERQLQSDKNQDQHLCIHSRSEIRLSSSTVEVRALVRLTPCMSVHGVNLTAPLILGALSLTFVRVMSIFIYLLVHLATYTYKYWFSRLL